MNPRALLLVATLASLGAMEDRRDHGETPPPTPPIALVRTAAPPTAPRDEEAAAPAVVPIPVTAPAADPQAIQRLEDRVDRLDHRLRVGDGAYRDGPLFTVDGGASLLERVRDRERELAATKTLAANRDDRIHELERELAATQARAARLAEQVDNLGQAHDQLMTAQQELAARGKTIASLTQQIDALALARLQAERLYFLLAKSVMELNPGQPQDVVDLQQRTRTQARDLDAAPSEQP